MSLANQTCWVVGGVGVIGRGITKALLKAGATVIVNSRSTSRLKRIEQELSYPQRLVTVHGSLLPGYASETVKETLGSSSLHHVIAHGAVRYWDAARSGHAGKEYDETHSIMSSSQSLLTVDTQDFPILASHLASLHLSAAQELFPRIQFSNGVPSYTFVTGDGGGHPGGKRSAFQEINAHHVWGLSAALRNEAQQCQNSREDRFVNCREVRIKIDVNRPLEERKAEPRPRPLSEDIGTLCAGLAAHTDEKDDIGTLMEASDRDTLDSLLVEYGHDMQWEAEAEKTG